MGVEMDPEGYLIEIGSNTFHITRYDIINLLIKKALPRDCPQVIN